MFNEDEVLEKINNYLKKLTSIINNDAKFSIFGIKFIKKKRIDDLLCCIEATLPKEYKDAIRKLGAQNFAGYTCYTELLNSFRKNKSLFADNYMIRHNIVLRQISVLKTSIRRDFKKVTQDNTNKF